MESHIASQDNLPVSETGIANDSTADRSANKPGAQRDSLSQISADAPLAAGDASSLSDSSLARGKATTETVIKSGVAIASVSRTTSGVSDDNSVLMRLFPPIEQSGSSIDQQLDPAGIELAHFRIEERIGRGGMGAVFRAVDTKLQRYVALKLLAPAQSHDSASVKRFQNEARAAARLDHENIARVYFIGEENGLHFIAFEFISGSTIRDLIAKQGKLSPHDTVNYALQVAYALNHTSGMGVVHRDIKPSNIIITPKGRSKLVDLGLARKNGSESQGELTLPGSTLGTFDYIAPEQAKDPRSVDVRSDIYSLGCTMYHMLSGDVPYPDGTVLQKLLDHQNKEAPDVAAISRNVPSALSAIVRTMMNSDRAKRFQTPDQLIKELTRVASTVGLRGVNPEGLVWVKAKSVQQKSWTSHFGWVLTVACLLSVVVLLEVFPELSRNLTGVSGPPSDDTSANQPAVVSNQTEGSGRVEQIANSNDKRDSDDQDTGFNDTGNELLANLTTKPRPNVKVEGNGPGTGPDTIILGTTKDDSKSPKPGDAETELKPIGPQEDDPKTSPGETVDPIDDQGRPFIVYAGDGSIKRRYLTLEAAVAELEDGSEIVLDFSGPRTEKPLRLSQSNVTIRAANGQTPVIEFSPTDSHTNMISLQNAQVQLLNVQFSMNIPNDAAGSHYSLFGLSQTSQLSLNRVVATISNPSGSASTSFIDSTHGFGEMPDMEMPGQEVDVLDVEISESIIRGDGVLAHVGFEKELDLTIQHSAIAISDDMFKFSTHTTSMLDAQLALRVDLNHVTAIVDGSIIRFAGPAKIENSSKVEWTSRNSVFTSISQSPFVLCDDNVAGEDARRLLSLVTSERNYYNQYEVFWSFVDDGTAFSFADWRTYWGSVVESRTKNDRVSFAVPFATLHDIVKIDFALKEPNAEVPNPAIEGAANGDNAGCDLARLPTVVLNKEQAAKEKAAAQAEPKVDAPQG